MTVVTADIERISFQHRSKENFVVEMNQSEKSVKLIVNGVKRNEVYLDDPVVLFEKLVELCKLEFIQNNIQFRGPVRIGIHHKHTFTRRHGACLRVRLLQYVVHRLLPIAFFTQSPLWTDWFACVAFNAIYKCAKINL